MLKTGRKVPELKFPQLIWLCLLLTLIATAGACGKSSTSHSFQNSLNQTQTSQPSSTLQEGYEPNDTTQQNATQSAFAPEQYYSTTVSELVDGDTIVAPIAGKDWNIRLIGIDTPEASAREQECGGAEATAFLAMMIPPGTPILLTRDIETYDIYDRLLAYVFRASDGLFVNLEMAKSGMASELSFDTNGRFLAHFKRAESEAKQNGIGVWGQCGGTDTPL